MLFVQQFISVFVVVYTCFRYCDSYVGRLYLSVFLSLRLCVVYVVLTIGRLTGGRPIETAD